MHFMSYLIATQRAVAKRMREIAAGLTDPADIKVAEDYADELDRAAGRGRTAVNNASFS
jgi:hypothetical protein